MNPRFHPLRRGLAAFLFAVLPAASAWAGPIPIERQAREAAARSLPYLADEGDIWIEEKKCVSCHQTGLLIWSHRLARDQGLAVNDAKLEEWTSWAIARQLSERIGENGEILPGLAGSSDLEGTGQLVLGGAFRDAKASGEAKRVGDFEKLIGLIRDGQQPEGSWKAGGQLPFQKRPKPETDALSTAWNVLALDVLGDDESRGRALAWLEKSGPKDAKSTEWSVASLLMTDRMGSTGEADAARAQLLSLQNADGGWGWLVGAPSDALATGQALYALGETGLRGGDFAAVEMAWQFLVKTQGEDGAWKVPSSKEAKKGAATEVSNFFGSAWAVIGICRTLPAPGS